ncbi:chromate transporter [Butyrivibrio sp. XB500-5]|uniref:chromate transporter n=1 Tax=Butyrivibrio sp. XB500-5 TaxID=2364880 RepID=UPI000EA8B263|nr:chromate transporter [Butyrivibrio sp. XB500-5]RKM58664.1 chromate transporter [Butyrivibrio sp. XB500-5]
MIYLDLFIGFLEVGFFSFGGAYAAIPLIKDVVTAHNWLDEEMLTYMIAISESTPGPIMVNMATYVGSEKGGLIGAAIATAAVVLPAFFIILLIMVAMNKFLKNRYVKAALSGLKPCIMGIILVTGVLMILKNCGLLFNGRADILTIVLTCSIAFIYFGSRLVMKKGMNPIMLICLSAFVGIVVYAF